MNQYAKAAQAWLNYLSLNDGNQPPRTLAISMTQGDKTVFTHRSGGDSSRDVFNIGSIAKLLTAALVVILEDQGQLSINDRAAAHLAWLNDHPDQRAHKITIKDLLTHRSGLPREGSTAEFIELNADFPNDGELKDLVLSSPILSTHKTKLKYSNLGYALLGQCLEVAAGDTYRRLVERHLLRPLGIIDHVQSDDFRSRRVPHYISDRPGRPRAIEHYIDAHTFDPAMGWWLDVDQLAKLCAAIYSGQLTGSAGLNSILRGQGGHWAPADRRGTDYGLGSIPQSIAGRTVHGHGGTFFGHYSLCLYDPQSDVTIASLTNSPHHNLTDIASTLFGLIDLQDNDLTSATASKYDEYGGTFFGVSGAIYFMPTSDGLRGLLLDVSHPTSAIDHLAYTDNDHFTITKAHDMLYLHEEVRFARNRLGIIDSVCYGGRTLKKYDSLDS